MMRIALFAVLFVCATAQHADAQGPLRRLLFGRPQCLPAPMCVQIEPLPAPASSTEPWGTLESRVTFRGELPKIEDWSEKLAKHGDKEHLLKAPKDDMRDPTWRIDPKTRGVANVCVFIKRPKDGVLPIHPADEVRRDAVVMDAPFCCFVPHMVAVYPEWFDGKERGKTGQQFIFKNSSPLAHAVRTTGNLKVNPSYNRLFPRKTENSFELRPQLLPVYLQCDIHVWMTAYVFVFDHPYFAITKADGSFTIPRVPAGMEVQVMAWHESQGWLLTKDGRAMTLKQGKNVLDFEISAK
jgi:hypothetical protein